MTSATARGVVDVLARSHRRTCGSAEFVVDQGRRCSRVVDVNFPRNGVTVDEDRMSVAAQDGFLGLVLGGEA